MTGKLIFKMEFYKFFNDKKYLIIAGVLAVLNIIIAVTSLDTIASMDASSAYGYGYNTTGELGAIMVIVLMMSMVFLFVYPFHVLAIDYKNNVMAMMMASGVNRTKLYFSKIGAALVCSLMLVIVVMLIPIMLIVIKAGSIGALGDIFSAFGDLFYYIDVNIFLFFLYLIVIYMTTIIIINAAVIHTKGSTKAVFLYFLFLILVSIARASIFSPIANIFEFTANGFIFYELIINVIVASVFVALSLRQLNNQNL